MSQSRIVRFQFNGLNLKFHLSSPFLPFFQTNLFPFFNGSSTNTIDSKTLISPFRIQIIFRPFSSKISEKHRNSFTVSYLINSCGLLPEIAIKVADKVHLHNPEKPDTALSFLKSHGFSKTQLSKLIRRRPSLLLSNTKKTLLPKLEFFYSIGFSKPDLARSLTSDPTILTRSLENQIIPSYRFLKSVLISDAKVVSALQRTPGIFLADYSKHLMPNISILREESVPESCISLLLTHFPETFMQKTHKFEEVVAEIKQMGFNPTKSTFVLALHAISGKGNKIIWNRCYDVYIKWGWSKDEILMAFKKQPNCMILSEKKISKGMEFFVDKMGQSSEMIAKNPVVLFLNLEKRIIPRCSVIKVLLAKGFVKRDLSLSTILLPVEKRFMDTYVFKHLEKVPQLLNLYHGKINLSQVLI